MHQVLVEVGPGLEEFELEVMRDLADNVVVICSIENFIDGRAYRRQCDRGPAMTLTDREYQRLRDMTQRIIRAGRRDGGQHPFAVTPAMGAWLSSR